METGRAGVRPAAIYIDMVTDTGGIEIGDGCEFGYVDMILAFLTCCMDHLTHLIHLPEILKMRLRRSGLRRCLRRCCVANVSGRFAGGRTFGKGTFKGVAR